MPKIHLFCYLSLSLLLVPLSSNVVNEGELNREEMNTEINRASAYSTDSNYAYYNKKVWYGNSQILRVIAKNGNAKLGYMDASVRATKFYSKTENNFFVLLNLETSSTPGLIAHRLDSSFEDGWKTKSTKINIGIKPDRSTTDIAYEYAGPVSTFKTVTVTSSFGSKFGVLGTIRSSGLSLKNNYIETSLTGEIWDDIQTSYSYTEPVLSAQFNPVDQTKKSLSYSWLYDFNWDLQPSMVTTYTYESFLFEVNPKYKLSDSDFGVNFTLGLEMICDKDWFAGDHGSSTSYTVNI